MGRPMWFVNLIKHYFPDRFLIAKLTKWPVVGKLIDRLLFAGDDVLYLPKDTVIPIHQPLTPQESVVLPSGVVDHFIEEAGYRWIMNTCFCRDANHCEHYPIDLGCVFLGAAVLRLNPKLGRLASKEEALDHVKRAREAGLVHMIGRNRIDTVWAGATPGNKLLTICNCCPCCCLWRVLPHLETSMSARVTRMPGVNVVITDRCVGCQRCTQDVCFVDAIHMEGSRAVISDACRGCGLCVEVCPTHAIQLTVDDDDFVEKSIARLSPLVDLK